MRLKIALNFGQNQFLNNMMRLFQICSSFSEQRAKSTWADAQKLIQIFQTFCMLNNDPLQKYNYVLWRPHSKIENFRFNLNLQQNDIFKENLSLRSLFVGVFRFLSGICLAAKDRNIGLSTFNRIILQTLQSYTKIIWTNLLWLDLLLRSNIDKYFTFFITFTV